MRVSVKLKTANLREVNFRLELTGMRVAMSATSDKCRHRPRMGQHGRMPEVC